MVSGYRRIRRGLKLRTQKNHLTQLHHPPPPWTSENTGNFMTTTQSKNLKGIICSLNIFNTAQLKSTLKCVFSVWQDINMEGFQCHFSPLPFSDMQQSVHAQAYVCWTHSPAEKYFTKTWQIVMLSSRQPKKNYLPAYETRAYQQVTRGIAVSHRQSSSCRASG